MLPLQQAIEVKQSIIEYIKATFHFKEESVYDAFYQFIESQERHHPRTLSFVEDSFCEVGSQPSKPLFSIR